LVVNWVSSCFSWAPPLLLCTYIFTGPLITIITLETNLLRFNKISLLCRYHWKREDSGWKQQVQRQGDFPHNSITRKHFFHSIHVLIAPHDGYSYVLTIHMYLGTQYTPNALPYLPTLKATNLHMILALLCR
jgi:hypothetical protein